MPPGGRRIPRATSVRRTKREASEDEATIPPLVAKAGGDLVALAARIRTCEDCDRACPQRAYGAGHPRAPVMLVGGHPSASDVESGTAFTSEAESLEKAFEALAIPLSWVYGATAVRCGDSRASTDQIVACSQHLLVEIEAVEPKVIVAFGGEAVEAVRALDGRCGIRVPDELPQSRPIRLRPGLSLISTEPMPDGVTQKESKRRLWRDLQTVPELIGRSD